MARKIASKREAGHPHIFHTKGRLAVLSAALILEILFVASILVWTHTNFLADVVSSVLVTETNADRSLEGLRALTVNPILVQAAQEKADDMAAKAYFAHVSPDGKTPWYWLNKVGYNFSAAGENLAVNFVDSTDVETAWMNSPEHRDNIMNSNYTEIGIATSHAVYNGQDTIFVVEYFGVPTATQSVSAPIKVAASSPQKNFVSTEPQTKSAKQPIKAGVHNPQPTTPSLPAAKPAPKSFWQSLFQKSSLVIAVASPRQTINFLYYILIALVIASLGWAIASEIKLARSAPILSGVLLIVILTGVVYVNYMVGTVLRIL